MTRIQLAWLSAMALAGAAVGTAVAVSRLLSRDPDQPTPTPQASPENPPEREIVYVTRRTMSSIDGLPIGYNSYDS